MRKKLVVETFFGCQSLLDRAEVIEKSIEDFNNSVYFSVKGSKEFEDIFID